MENKSNDSSLVCGHPLGIPLTPQVSFSC